MKNSRFIIFIIILSFFCAQCKKDEVRTIVEVTALDKTTNHVIPNAKITLVAETYSTFMGPSYYAIVEEKYTNIAGKYTFDFKANNSWAYFLVATAEHYFNTDEHTGNIENGQMNYVAIPLQPEAFLKVNVKNTQPFDIYDLIYVDPYGTPSGGGGTFTGMNVDTFTIARVWGNTKEGLYWRVNKNSSNVVHKDSIFCPAFDTTAYTINF